MSNDQMERLQRELAETEPPAPPMSASQEQQPEPEPQPARGKAGKKEAAEKPKSVSAFKGYLDRILPTAERMKVWKREALGKLVYLEQYSVSDVERVGDMEVFLQQYIVPKVGPGTFEIGLINSKNEESRRVEFTVHDPNRAPGDKPNDVVINKVVTEVLEENKKMRTEMAAQANKKEIPMHERLAEAKAMMELLGGGDKKMDPMMMFMLMQGMGGNKPVDDPRITSLERSLDKLTDLVTRQASEQRLPPPMPMLPPEPPIDIGALTRSITEAVRPQFKITDIIAAIPALMPLIRPAPTEKPWGPKDLIGMLPVVSPLLEKMFGKDEVANLKAEVAKMQNAPSRGLRETLDDMKLLQEVTGGGQRDDADPDNFWGFANNILLNLDSLGDVLSKLKDEPGETHGANKQPEHRQIQAAPKKKSKSKYPPGFEEHVKALRAAREPAERIQASLRAFMFLGKSPPYDKYLKFVYGLIRAADQGNEKAGQKAFQFVVKFLEGLRDSGMLKPVTVKNTVKAFADNFDKVITLVAAQLAQQQKPRVTAPGEEPDDEDDEAEDEGEEHEEVAAEAAQPAPEPAKPPKTKKPKKTAAPAANGAKDEPAPAATETKPPAEEPVN